MMLRFRFCGIVGSVEAVASDFSGLVDYPKVYLAITLYYGLIASRDQAWNISPTSATPA